jgi:hypothetical protein
MIILKQNVQYEVMRYTLKGDYLKEKGRGSFTPPFFGFSFSTLPLL